MSNPDNLPNDEEELEGEDPPESLDNLTDELIMYAKEHDIQIGAEWDPDECVYIIYSDDLDPVDVFVIDIPDDMYGEAEAIVVETVVGELSDKVDTAELLRFCDADLVYGRMTITRGESNGPELVLMQAACPLSQISAAMLDAMIREVAVFSSEARKFFPELPEEDKEDKE